MKVVTWLKENQCPLCYNKLVCIEVEETINDVTDEGYLEPYFNGFDSIYQSKLYCPQCNKEFDATVKDGMVKRNKPKTTKREYNPFYGG